MTTALTLIDIMRMLTDSITSMLHMLQPDLVFTDMLPSLQGLNKQAQHIHVWLQQGNIDI